MARDRLELQTILEGILGSTNVYFQPPHGKNMSYPCIAYERDYEDVQHADNNRYTHYKRYAVTVIDRNPDSDIPDKVGALPMCEFNRFYTADNLNHDVYRLYF